MSKQLSDKPELRTAIEETTFDFDASTFFKKGENGVVLFESPKLSDDPASKTITDLRVEISTLVDAITKAYPELKNIPDDDTKAGETLREFGEQLAGGDQDAVIKRFSERSSLSAEIFNSYRSENIANLPSDSFISPNGQPEVNDDTEEDDNQIEPMSFDIPSAMSRAIPSQLPVLIPVFTPQSQKARNAGNAQVTRAYLSTLNRSLSTVNSFQNQRRKILSYYNRFAVPARTSRRSSLPFPATQLIENYGKQGFEELFLAVYRTLSIDPVNREVFHLPDIQGILRDELLAAYRLLELETNIHIWQSATIEAAEIVREIRQRKISKIDTRRANFLGSSRSFVACFYAESGFIWSRPQKNRIRVR